jgi:hypothetical protein
VIPTGGARLCESQQRGFAKQPHRFLCRLDMRSGCGSQTRAPALPRRGNVIQRSGTSADCRNLAKNQSAALYRGTATPVGLMIFLAGRSRRSLTKADRQSGSDQLWAEGWIPVGILMRALQANCVNEYNFSPTTGSFKSSAKPSSSAARSSHWRSCLPQISEHG